MEDAQPPPRDVKRNLAKRVPMALDVVADTDAVIETAGLLYPSFGPRLRGCWSGGR